MRSRGFGYAQPVPNEVFKAPGSSGRSLAARHADSLAPGSVNLPAQIGRVPAARRRALGVFVLLAAGIVIARALPTPELADGPLDRGPISPTALFAATTVLAVLAAMLGPRSGALAGGLAVVVLGAGWTLHRTGPWPEGSLAHHLPSDPGAPAILLEVRGVVLSPVTDGPQPLASWDVPTQAFDLGVFAVHPSGAQPAPVSGTVRVRVRLRDGSTLARADALPVRPGQLVRVQGLARGPQPPANPGERDRRPSMRESGHVGWIRCESWSLVHPIDHDASAPALLRFQGFIAAARAAVSDRATGPLFQAAGQDTEPQQLLRALLVGERTDVELIDRFARLGVLHVLAISGFHLVVLAAAARLALRATGDRGPWEPAAVALVLLGYMLIAPWSGPVIRAGVMVLALLAGEALGRRHDRVAVLAWTASALLLVRPLDLFDLGFQLSFALVLALLVVMPVLTQRWSADIVLGAAGPAPVSPAVHALRALRSAFASGLLCWLVASPIIAFHTGMVSLLAVATTLLIAPIASLVLALSAAAMLLAVVAPVLADQAAHAIVPIAQAILKLAHAIDTIPGTWHVLPALSVAWTIAAVALALAWMFGPAGAPRALGRPALWLASAIVLGWLVAHLHTPSASRDQSLRIDTLAVGDGTCHLIRAGQHSLLWDCGSISAEIGRTAVPQAVRAMGGWRVPTAVITHANADHCNALAHAAQRLGLRRVLTTQHFLDEASAPGPFRDLLRTLQGRGVDVVAVARGDRVALGPWTMRVLWPPRAGDPAADLIDPTRPLAANDTSIAAIFEHANHHPAAGRDSPSLLMTGDLQRAGLAGLMVVEPGLRATVLEAPHHGSYNDLAAGFVASVQPSVVVQSTGPQRLGDPRWAQARSAAKWLCTAQAGAIHAVIPPHGPVHVRTHRDHAPSAR